MHRAQAVVDVQVLVGTQQVVARYLDRKAVVEERLGHAQIELPVCPVDIRILFVAARGEGKIGLGGERGKDLEIVVPLHKENGALGADETNRRRDFHPVFEQAHC